MGGSNCTFLDRIKQYSLITIFLFSALKLRADVIIPRHVISLVQIEELKHISLDRNGLIIGSAATISDLEKFLSQKDDGMIFFGNNKI